MDGWMRVTEELIGEQSVDQVNNDKRVGLRGCTYHNQCAGRSELCANVEHVVCGVSAMCRWPGGRLSRQCSSRSSGIGRRSVQCTVATHIQQRSAFSTVRTDCHISASQPHYCEPNLIRACSSSSNRARSIPYVRPVLRDSSRKEKRGISQTTTSRYHLAHCRSPPKRCSRRRLLLNLF